MAAARAELAAIEPARACCRVAERAGLGAAALGRARSPAIARLAVRLPGLGPHDSVAFQWATARNHCRVAYLRGVFLATGSLSLSIGRTHLEFVVSQADAPVLVARLTEMEMAASWRVRRGRGVVTWKSADRILRFLRLAGAGGSALELESRLVTRSLQGHLNRVINAETANLSRSVASASRQLELIDQVERYGTLGGLPKGAQEVARLRRELPEASFTEIADRLGMSRARVQRAFGQLESAALDEGPSGSLSGGPSGGIGEPPPMR